MRSKRFTYCLSVVVAMAFFFPFRSYPWSIYLGACAGYTALVFGLRRIDQKKTPLRSMPAVRATKVALNHSGFLIAVVAWVWLLDKIKPHLPYIFRTEDSSHPYFGLIFIGVFVLMMLELYEQRWLRGDPTANREHEDQLAQK